MADEHTVTTCLVSFAQHNGFVNLQINNGPLHHRDVLSAGKIFFAPDVQLVDARVTFGSDGGPEDKPFDMVVLFDRGLHGTKECPYLALKLIDKEKIINLGREDYMNVMKSVEYVIARIQPADNETTECMATREDSG
ncbi:hypothetical protein DFJ58DRAFT_845794 [Suillus subalutaceus]|uniref:uncharacterized protein n=1 Tax=Suillus subalutaceus TaxID=48586 RepID=UPI001B883EB4|nr:uncharacterized protein DFJ58DRAFT_845794 [Suillus subalutaceus]KAG1839107.1 hypothetical protein DFJ58DRAFT_845794 [Suillus subalutaceus]